MKEVLRIAYAAQENTLLQNAGDQNATPVAVVKGTVLYVYELGDTLSAKIEANGAMYRVDSEDAIYTDETGISKYSAPTVSGVSSSTSRSGASRSGGGSGGNFRITFYCSACNSPKGTDTVALSGSHAFIGSCAYNGAPLGSYIDVPGYGSLFVNDRVGRNGVVDIWRGWRDICDCG